MTVREEGNFYSSGWMFGVPRMRPKTQTELYCGLLFIEFLNYFNFRKKINCCIKNSN
jgi:hypothetical protein